MTDEALHLERLQAYWCAEMNGKVIVSARNRKLLEHGEKKPFDQLSDVQKYALKMGYVGVHVCHNGDLTKVTSCNAKKLDLENRRYWCGEIPMKELNEMMETDEHYKKNYPEDDPGGSFESDEYPVALEPDKTKKQTLADGYHRFEAYRKRQLAKVPALAGVEDRRAGE